MFFKSFLEESVSYWQNCCNSTIKWYTVFPRKKNSILKLQFFQTESHKTGYSVFLSSWERLKPSYNHSGWISAPVKSTAKSHLLWCQREKRNLIPPLKAKGTKSFCAAPGAAQTSNCSFQSGAGFRAFWKEKEESQKMCILKNLCLNVQSI